MRKLAEISITPVNSILAHLGSEMGYWGMSEEEQDATYIAVAEALGVKNEDDTPELSDTEILERCGLCG